MTKIVRGQRGITLVSFNEHGHLEGVPGLRITYVITYPPGGPRHPQKEFSTCESLSLTGATAVLAVTLAACGGVDKNAYVESVTKVQQKTQNEANKLSSEMAQAKTPKDIGLKLEELGAEVAANAKELDAIEAPSEVTKQHQQYVDLMNRFSTSLEKLGKEFETAKTSELPKVLSDTTKLTSDLASDESKSSPTSTRSSTARPLLEARRPLRRRRAVGRQNGRLRPFFVVRRPRNDQCPPPEGDGHCWWAGRAVAAHRSVAGRSPQRSRSLRSSARTGAGCT